MGALLARFEKLGVHRIGQLFELVFCFLFLPAVTSTMDRGPLFLGGHVLLWAGTIALLMRLSPEDRASVRTRLRTGVLPMFGGWIGPIVAMLLVAMLLGMFFQLQGWWIPPKGLVAGGLPAALLYFIISSLATAVPVEILFRGYIPQRFSDIFVGRLRLFYVPIIGFLFAWMFLPVQVHLWGLKAFPLGQPTFFALVFFAGMFLGLLERMGTAFWLVLLTHAAGAWLWTMTSGFGLLNR